MEILAALLGMIIGYILGYYHNPENIYEKTERLRLEEDERLKQKLEREWELWCHNLYNELHKK